MASETEPMWLLPKEIPTWGWYYYAPDRKDWDIHRAVPITRHEYGNGLVEFTVKLQSDQPEINALELPGMFFGPLPRATRPNNALLATSPDRAGTASAG